MADKYDVLVMGGGPAGMPAASALATAGRRVLFAERNADLGGRCLFESCIPSKVLHESARRLQAIHHAAEFGLRLPPGRPHVDWQVVIARKDALLEQGARRELGHARKIPTLDVRFGHVTLLHPHRALVKAAGDPFKVEFVNAIIATGAKPAAPVVPGSGLARMMTSEQLLDLARPPRSLVVVGSRRGAGADLRRLRRQSDAAQGGFADSRASRRRNCAHA